VVALIPVIDAIVLYYKVNIFGVGASYLKV